MSRTQRLRSTWSSGEIDLPATGASEAPWTDKPGFQTGALATEQTNKGTKHRDTQTAPGQALAAAGGAVELEPTPATVPQGPPLTRTSTEIRATHTEGRPERAPCQRPTWQVSKPTAGGPPTLQGVLGPLERGRMQATLAPRQGAEGTAGAFSAAPCCAWGSLCHMCSPAASSCRDSARHACPDPGSPLGSGPSQREQNEGPYHWRPAGGLRAAWSGHGAAVPCPGRRRLPTEGKAHGYGRPCRQVRGRHAPPRLHFSRGPGTNATALLTALCEGNTGSQMWGVHSRR